MNGLLHALAHAGPMRAVSVVMHGMVLHCNRAGVWAVAAAFYWQRIYVASTTCAGRRSIMTTDVLDVVVPTADSWTWVPFGTIWGTLAR